MARVSNFTSPTSLHQLHFTYLLNQKNIRLTITMAGLARDKYCEQYQQCAALHDEKKWEECTRVGLRNMADCTMPPYFQIKTLILMVGAERDSWYKAEVSQHHYCPPKDLS
jgi:hypothetical protein